MKKSRYKYTYKIIKKDNGAVLYESSRKFRNKDYCYKCGCWFASFNGFESTHCAIAIQPYEKE